MRAADKCEGDKIDMEGSRVCEGQMFPGSTR